MEQEPIYCEPIEPDFSQPSRRAFLRTITTAAAASALLIEEEPAEAKETVDSFVDYCSVESKLGRIDYPEKPKELAPEARELILAITTYQKSWLNATRLDDLKPDDSSFEMSTHTEENISQKERDTAWQKMKACFQGLGQFDDRAFQRTLIYDTPRYLAQFGILAISYPFLAFEPSLSRFTRTESLLDFHQIGRREHQTIEREGRTITRNVLYISGPLKIDGADVNTSDMIKANGQMHYQNIIIYDYHIGSDALGQTCPEMDEAIAEIKTLSPDEIWQPIENAADPRNVAFWLANIRLWDRSNKAWTSLREERQRYIRTIIEHETGHLLDDTDPNFIGRFPQHIFTSPLEYLKQRENLEVHSEIDAILYGLRYGDDREKVLRDIVSFSTTELKQDFTHDHAISWIIDRLVESIIKNPSRYGISVSPERKVSVENQIIAQLDHLLDNYELLDQLTEQVLAIHRQRLDEDFSQEYFVFSGLEAKREAALAHNRAESRKIGLRWSAIGTALFSTAGGLILHRIIKRRQANEKREAQKQKKGKKKK